MSTEPSQAQPRSRHEIREARIRAEQDLLSTGQVPLITRREIRRQRAEAEALRNAIAAGEITAEEARAIQEGDLFVITPAPEVAAPKDAPSGDAAVPEDAAVETAGVETEGGSKPAEASASTPAGAETVESAAVEEPVVEPETAAETMVVAEPVAAVSAEAEVSEDASAPGAAEDPASQSVTRRPVLRVPAAQGVRQLDPSTGEISGVIPVDETFTGIETPQWRALVPDADGSVTDGPAQGAETAAVGAETEAASDLHELLVDEPAKATEKDSLVVRRLAVALMVMVVALVLATVLWFVLGRSGSIQLIGGIGQATELVVRSAAVLVGA